MNINRREFIKRMLSLGLSAAAASALFSWFSCRSVDNSMPQSSTPPGEDLQTLPPSSPGTSSNYPYLAVARGNSAVAITEAAVGALGGMQRFVKPGAEVILKPNICVGYRTPEYAATTNPEVVATLTRLCIDAGARRVRVMDAPFSGTPGQAYESSGIAQAVKEAGGEMEIMSRIKYREEAIPRGRTIKSWPVYGDLLDADVLINVPVAKVHGSTTLTLGMKNLLGGVQNANRFHLLGLHQCIADLNTAVRPALTVVDAVRILTGHGPSGGNLEDVKLANTVIASQDIVAADSYAATLFGLKGADIDYIRRGAEMGLGAMDLDAMDIEELNV